EDNWKIHGTLTRPAGLVEKRRVAAVLFLHSSSHDQDIFSQHSYPAFTRLQNELITLRIDIRGRGKSERPLELHSFTPQQRESLYLDVKAALNFLSEQAGVDSRRIGIFAEELSADSAVLGAAGDPRVRALVLISGRLSARAKQLIESLQVPILGMVSSEDRDGFRDLTDAYKLSRIDKSDILIYNGLGLALAMFSTWRYNRPDEKPLDDIAVDWLIEQLNTLGDSQEISFTTEDGWIISADLVRPIREGHSPAVVLVHSSVTDRHMYHTLVEKLVEQGFIVLNIDFRGRGKSRNKGNWLELRLKAPEGVAEIDRGYLDVKAAVDYLRSRDDVGSIGVVGTVIGARYALLSAAKDQRITTVVSVIGYVPNEAENEELNANKVPVLYILSRDLVPVTQAMTALYQNTVRQGSKLVELAGGTYGYGVFTLNPQLVPMIVDWMKRQLSN
ncbi:MAG TPA: dienelactone hydrolase family protein, partial [Pyrinomonadaceae bacterium]|nr:dienelactone hydrolase family protein [Pyrinomonadaceae bacterium]